MMMNNMKKISLAVIAISTAMLSTSCLREDNFGGGDGKFVSFKVSADNVMGTKSGSGIQGLEMVDLSENGHNLYLFGSVQANNATPFGPMTKAAASPYTKDDAASVEEFYVKMNGTEGVATKETISLGDIWYMYKDGNKVEWDDENNAASFLAYYYNPESTVSSASFVERSSNKVYFEGDGSEDFLVAYNEHSHNDSTYPSTTANYVPLTFKHPLALVKFHVENVRVAYVVINNAATSGTIEYNSDSFSSDSFSYDPDIEKNIWIASEDEENVDEMSIYLMPGDIGSDDINITFYIDEDKDGVTDYILSTKNLGVDKWEAGYIYNYTISDAKFPDVVDIEVIDKDNVVIQNDFTNAVYLRAAVVANWVDAKGRIVEAWDPEDASIDFNTYALGWMLNDGTIKDRDGNTPDYGSDGYFYHISPVVGYGASDALINAISASTKGDLTLQVSVAVQAVAYDHEKAAAVAAWGPKIKDLIGGLQ